MLVLIVVALAGGWLAKSLLSPRTIRASKPKFTKPQTVCLDPGHGGSDPGATYKDLTERDMNLVVAEKVQNLLEDQGYQVFMTRTSNVPDLSNHDRYTYCNTKRATIMVSIHHNYFDDDSVDYTTVLYFKSSDQALAADILSAELPKLGLTSQGTTNFEDGVLSESNMPAALSEAFFITSDSEYNQITASGSTRLADEASAVAAGIETYFNPPPPPSQPAR